MSWTLRLALALVLFLPPQLMADNALLTSIGARLTTAEELHCRFEQEKNLPFLTRPLRSSGEISISREHGLRWRVNKPVVSEMTVDISGVQLDGRPVKDNGSGKLIASLMQAFMTGELAALEQNFALTGQLSDERWQLVLRPRSSFLKAALTRVEVDGASTLQQVVIVEQNGTISTIHLLPTKPAIGELHHPFEVQYDATP